MSAFLYRYRAALDRRTPSMIDAWFSSSETIASSAPKRTSNTPPLASKHELYRIVASVPRKEDSRSSSSVCWVWVPQMKRTDAIPKPHVSRACLLARTTSGWSAKPR